MPLDSIMGKGRLPEKPWRTDTFIRLVASVVVCWLSGMMVILAFGFFGESHRKSEVLFLLLTLSTLTCFAVALFVLARPWPHESFLRELLISMITIYGGFCTLLLAARLLGDKYELENSTTNMIIGILSLQGAALVLVHFFLREHNIGWSEGFGFSNESKQSALIGVIVALPVLLVAWGLQLLSILVLQSLHFQAQEQEAVQILQSTEGWWNRLFMGVATIIIAPVAEEVLFRGIMYPTIKRIGYPRLAWWITAIVFAAIHHNLATFVPLVFLATVLIWLYERTGNLLACIVTHSFFNAVNFIFLYVFQN